MRRSLRELIGYKILAQDGEIGKVEDFYFDDRSWTIRYLVIDTGNWLFGREVLISPVSLGKPEWQKKLFPVQLTKSQIENSPGIHEDKPVSRQMELDLIQYYQWPDYWRTVGVTMPENAMLVARAELPKDDQEKSKEENPHLRSVEEVSGYHIRASDGEIGHVEDYIADDESWILRYIVVDTRNWLPWGKRVLVSPSWIERVKWRERRVHVDLPVKLIEKSPEFDLSQPVNREYENRLYDYYGRPVYWDKKK